ncbi:MAG: hypothetical protein ACO268_00475 [Opitutales bacterium]|jgi:hypothetical protein
MRPVRALTWMAGAASLIVFFAGTISIMSLRIAADEVGSRIVRLERSAAEAQKELERLRRDRDQTLDTIQLQERVGENFRPPPPEQVVWIPRIPYAPPPPAAGAINAPGPRMTAREVAFRPMTGQGGTALR